jgi:hypothetical protein
MLQDLGDTALSCACVEITPTKRWMASRLYGRVPEATFDEALKHFQQADVAHTSSCPNTIWLMNSVWMVKAMLQLKLKAEACREVKRALAYVDSSNCVQLTHDDNAAIAELKLLQSEKALY